MRLPLSHKRQECCRLGTRDIRLRSLQRTYSPSSRCPYIASRCIILLVELSRCLKGEWQLTRDSLRPNCGYKYTTVVWRRRTPLVLCQCSTAANNPYDSVHYLHTNIYLLLNLYYFFLRLHSLLYNSIQNASSSRRRHGLYLQSRLEPVDVAEVSASLLDTGVHGLLALTDPDTRVVVLKQ